MARAAVSAREGNLSGIVTVNIENNSGLRFGSGSFLLYFLSLVKPFGGNLGFGEVPAWRNYLLKQPHKYFAVFNYESRKHNAYHSHQLHQNVQRRTCGIFEGVANGVACDGGFVCV